MFPGPDLLLCALDYIDEKFTSVSGRFSINIPFPDPFDPSRSDEAEEVSLCFGSSFFEGRGEWWCGTGQSKHQTEPAHPSVYDPLGFWGRVGRSKVMAAVGSISAVAKAVFFDLIFSGPTSAAAVF